MRTEQAQTDSAITIRRIDRTDSDLAALARLAELDTHAALEGPVLGVEVEGRLLAAISTATGDVVADPFSRTTELRALLELRVGQLRGRRAKRLRGVRASRRVLAPVGGSEPGQIIALPRVN